MCHGKKPFKIIEGKGENAGDQHFSFFHNVIKPTEENLNHLSHPEIVAYNFFNVDKAKIEIFFCENSE